MITREFLESIRDLESVLKMKRRELAHLRETLDLKGVSYENIGAALQIRFAPLSISRNISRLMNSDLRLCVLKLQKLSADWNQKR